MKSLVVGLLLLLSQVASAITYEKSPCSPLFLADRQGRPIPGAVINIYNPDGTAVITPFYWDRLGTLPFVTGSALPNSQIFQVFGTTGTYQVVIGGAGLTKTFQMVCVDVDLVSTFRTISIDRTADVIVTKNMPSPPLYGCPPDGSPCSLAYDVSQTASFDFMMPSFSASFSSLLLTWSSNTPGIAGWTLDWCVYKEGEPSCHPDGTNAVTLASLTGGNWLRTDLLVLPDSWSTNWTVDDHVVVWVGRSNDQFADLAYLENVRLEFSRQ